MQFGGHFCQKDLQQTAVKDCLTDAVPMRDLLIKLQELLFKGENLVNAYSSLGLEDRGFDTDESAPASMKLHWEQGVSMVKGFRQVFNSLVEKHVAMWTVSRLEASAVPMAHVP